MLNKFFKIFYRNMTMKISKPYLIWVKSIFYKNNLTKQVQILNQL